MDLIPSSNCSNCELSKKNLQENEERFFQYKKLLIHTNKLLEKYDILIQHSKTVEDKLKREQASAAQVKKILVPLLTQLLPLQNVKNKFESQLKDCEDEIELLKGVVIAEKQQTKQYSALSSRLEADLKSANAMIENTKEQLNATKKNIKHDAATHKLGQEKLIVALQSALELSCILKQHKLLPLKYINRLRGWKKQLMKLDDNFHENQFSPSMSSIDAGFESSKCSSDEEYLISYQSLPNFIEDSKSCLRNDIGINTNLSMQNHSFESIISPSGDNCVEVADIGRSLELCDAELSQIDMIYTNDYLISPTVSKTSVDIMSDLDDEVCESSSDSVVEHLEEIHDENIVADAPYKKLENCDLEKILDNMKIDMPVILSPMMPDGPCDKCFHPKRDVSTMTRVEVCDASTNHETISINVGVQCTLSDTGNSCAEVAVQCNILSSKNDEILNVEMEILNQHKHNADKIMKDIGGSLYNDTHPHPNVLMMQILDELKKIDAALGVGNSENVDVVHEPFCEVKSIWENSDIKTEQEKSLDSSQMSCSQLDNVSKGLCKSNQYSFPYRGSCCSCNHIPSRNLHKNSSNLESFQSDIIKTKDKHKLQFPQGSVRCKKKLKRLNSRIRLNSKLNKCNIVTSSSGNFFETPNIGLKKQFKRPELKPKVKSHIFNSKNRRHKSQNLKQTFRNMTECSNISGGSEFTNGAQVLKPRKLVFEMAKSCINSSTQCPVLYSTNSGPSLDREDTVNTNAVMPVEEGNKIRNISLSIDSDKLPELSSEYESESDSEYESIPEMNNKSLLSATNLSNDSNVSKQISQMQLGKVKVINKDKDSSLLCNESPMTDCILNVEETYIHNNASIDLEFESGLPSNFTIGNVSNLHQTMKDMVKSTDKFNAEKCSSITPLEEFQHCKSNEYTTKISPIMAWSDYCVKDTNMNTTGSESEDAHESDWSNENFDVTQSEPIGNDSESASDDTSVENNSIAGKFDASNHCIGNDSESASDVTSVENNSIAGNFDASNQCIKTSFNKIETKKCETNYYVLPMSCNDLEQKQIGKLKIVRYNALACNGENKAVSCVDKTSSSEITSDCDKIKHNSHIENAVSRNISTKAVVCHNFLSPAPIIKAYYNRNRSLRAKALANEFKDNFQKKSTSIKCQAIGSNIKEHKANVPEDKCNVEMLFGSDNDSSDEHTIEIEQPRNLSKWCHNLAPGIKNNLHNKSEELNVNLVYSKVKPALRKAKSYSHIQSVGLLERPIKRTKSLPTLFKYPESLKRFFEYKNCSRLGQMSWDNFEQFQRKGIKRTNLYLSLKPTGTCTNEMNLNENVKEVESTILPIPITSNKQRIAHVPGVRKLRTSSAIVVEKQLQCKPSTTSSFDLSENLHIHSPHKIVNERNNDGCTLVQRCQKEEEFGGSTATSNAKTLSKLSCESDQNRKNVKCVSKLGMLRQQFIKQKRKYKIMLMDETHKKSGQTVDSQANPPDTSKRLCVRNETEVEFDANPRSCVKNHLSISPKHSNKKNASKITSDDHRSDVLSDKKVLENCATELSTKSEFFDSSLQLAVSNSSNVQISKNANVSDSSKEITTNNLQGKKINEECSVPCDLPQSPQLVALHELTCGAPVIPLNRESLIKEVSKTKLREELRGNQVTPVNRIDENLKMKSFPVNKQLESKVKRFDEAEYNPHIKHVDDSISPVISPERKRVVSNVCGSISQLQQPTSMSDINKYFIYEKGGVLESALQFRNCARERKFLKNYEGNLKLEVDKFLCKNLTSDALYEAANVLNETSDVESLSRYIFEVVRDDSSDIDRSFTPPALPLTSTQQKLLTLMMVMQKDLVDFASLIDVFLSAVECFVLKLSSNAPSALLLCKLARFYCAVCRIETCTTRVHAFCYDALYCLKRKCFPLIYTVLRCYPEALPKASVGMQLPRCVAMVHVIMSTNINSVNATFKLSDLKYLLRNMYGYNNNEGLILDNIMQFFLKKLKHSSSESKEIQASLILLAKIHGLNWTITSLIRKGIIPIIRDWFEGKLPEAPALQSVEILGAVLKPFSCDIDVTKEVTVLGGILSNKKASFNLKLATVMSLSKLICHNYALVANFLYNWIPEEPVPKTFLTNLSYLLLTRPYPSWKTYLKSKKVEK